MTKSRRSSLMLQKAQHRTADEAITGFPSNISGEKLSDPLNFDGYSLAFPFYSPEFAAVITEICLLNHSLDTRALGRNLDRKMKEKWRGLSNSSRSLIL